MHTTTHFDYERRRHSSLHYAKRLSFLLSCLHAFYIRSTGGCRRRGDSRAAVSVGLPQESHAISAAPAKANQRVLLARLRRRRAAGLQRLFRSYQARREYPEPALLRHEHAHVPRTLHCPVAAREGHMPRVPRRNTLNVVVTRCLPSAPPLRHRRGSKRALLSFPL